MSREAAADHDEFLRSVLRSLEPLPVTARRLFGGYGLYLEGAFFGVVSDGRLYFRTDERTRPDYLARGMEALQPRYRVRGPTTVDRNFEVPPEIRREREALRAWALRAAASRRR